MILMRKKIGVNKVKNIFTSQIEQKLINRQGNA